MGLEPVANGWEANVLATRPLNNLFSIETVLSSSVLDADFSSCFSWRIDPISSSVFFAKELTLKQAKKENYEKRFG